jgi:hypothetical protein
MTSRLTAQQKTNPITRIWAKENTMQHNYSVSPI